MNHSDLTVASECVREPAPIQKLFDVFELCEQVLDYLPMYDVLRATQVCRTFQQNIKNSHRLQVKLFLAPDLTRKRWAVSPTGTLLSGPKAERQIAAATSTGHSETGEVTCYTLHPSLQLEPRSKGWQYAGIVARARHRVDTSSFTTSDYAGIRDSNMLPTDQGSKASSLDNMLLTQSPMTLVALDFARLRSGGYCLCASNTGVTFGDIFKEARRLDKPVAGRGLRSIRLCYGFAASTEAIEAVERAGEMTSEDDPTRWVMTDDGLVLKDGGFEF